MTTFPPPDSLPQRIRGQALDDILSRQPGSFPAFVGRAGLPPVVQADALVLSRIRDLLPGLAAPAADLPVTAAGSTGAVDAPQGDM